MNVLSTGKAPETVLIQISGSALRETLFQNRFCGA